MINSIGLDLVEIARIDHDLRLYGERFVGKILGKEEWKIFQRKRNRAQFLAGRFAAKEAVIKALGFYLKERPGFGEIQIINDETGQPQLQLSDRVQRILPDFRSLISITHDNYYAAAVAIFEEER
ncbi:MAG: holo-ACP synthase [Candidatus Zixiibacteriota bacterium]|nr:MAG: holo-ACP synthase [candidate division Zixibacteria bacterium]